MQVSAAARARDGSEIETVPRERGAASSLGSRIGTGSATGIIAGGPVPRVLRGRPRQVLGEAGGLAPVREPDLPLSSVTPGADEMAANIAAALQNEIS
jgi:hypothetical protein